MNNLNTSSTELKSLIKEAYNEMTDSLEQEMELWKRRAVDPVGRILNDIEKEYSQILAPESDEYGMQDTPISRFKMAYTLDNIGPARWIKGLIQTLVNADMVQYDERKGKCVGIDGDVSMARLVNKLIDMSHKNESKQYTNESADYSSPEDVVNKLTQMRNSGKMVGFDMSDYVDGNGDSASYMAINYNPEDNELYAGYITNSGIKKEIMVQYDHDMSFDDNLQHLYDSLVDQLTSQGYSNDGSENFDESTCHDGKVKTNESMYGQESTPDEVEAEISKVRQSGRWFAFNMDDYVKDDGITAGVMPIVYDKESDTLYCGGATNAGVFREAEIQYDHTMSLDSNLEALMEVLQQTLMDQGYYPQQQD